MEGIYESKQTSASRLAMARGLFGVYIGAVTGYYIYKEQIIFLSHLTCWGMTFSSLFYLLAACRVGAVRAMTILFQCVFTIEIVITILYWAVVYPDLEQGEQETWVLD
jgi:hypothetical protein